MNEGPLLRTAIAREPHRIYLELNLAPEGMTGLARANWEINTPAFQALANGNEAAESSPVLGLDPSTVVVALPALATALAKSR